MCTLFGRCRRHHRLSLCHHHRHQHRRHRSQFRPFGLILPIIIGVHGFLRGSVAFVWFAVYSRDFGCACAGFKALGNPTDESRIHRNENEKQRRRKKKKKKKREQNSFVGFSGKLFAVRVRAIILSNFYQTKRNSNFGARLSVPFAMRCLLGTKLGRRTPFWTHNSSIQLRCRRRCFVSVWIWCTRAYRINARVELETDWRLVYIWVN